MRINPFLHKRQETSLYLFNLELNPTTLDKFKNIKYVIMQGSSKRAHALARQLAHLVLNLDMRFYEPVNLVNTSNFAVYRVGNILSVSHGMGNISIDALLHTITKLLYYAGNTAVEYIRVGTSGGIGVEAGSIIITQNAYMPNLAPYYTSYELDQARDLPTYFDSALIARILAAQPENPIWPIIIGNTIAADDFYLGQCRYDGAMFARQNLNFRTNFFNKIRDLNILNFEMESSSLAAFCIQAQIPATMIAVTVVNRLNGDQITATPAQLTEYSDRAQQVVINYLQILQANN